MLAQDTRFALAVAGQHHVSHQASKRGAVHGRVPGPTLHGH